MMNLAPQETTWAPLASVEQITKHKAKEKRLLMLIRVPAITTAVLAFIADYVGVVDINALFVDFIMSIWCVDGGGVFGFRLLMYGLVLGVLLVAWVCVLFCYVPRQLKIVRASQHPLPGEVVFEPTKIRKGFHATLLPATSLIAFLVVMPIAFIIIAVNIESLASVIPARDMVKMCSDISSNAAH